MNKLILALAGPGRAGLALVIMLGCAQNAPGGTFNVTTVTDSHAVNPSSSPIDSSGLISLRSAIEAANAQGGATINLPAGTFNLTLGELSLAPGGHLAATVVGAGPSSTVVNQNDGINRVFNIDIGSAGSTAVSLSGMTIQGGHDAADGLGGAGILAGSITSTPKDTLTLLNCVVRNNSCQTNTTREPGGGVQMAGGDLILSGCTFSNNTSGQSFGGAIFMLAQSVVSSLEVTNSLFANNNMTNNSGAGPDGGGAIMIETPAGSSHTVIGCTFAGNQVLGNSGNTYGGALQVNGGALDILYSTFVTNSATGQGGLGGALYVDSGTVNMSFCRLAGNTATHGGGALYNHASNGASTTATNDWWGCGAGPGGTGCDVVGTDGGALTFSPWIVITNVANPDTINLGQSTTLTASVLTNSSNQVLTPAQVQVLIGLPIVWNGAVHGSLSAAQAILQANGQATATFHNDNTCNTGSANATLDSGTAVGIVFIRCPDLTIAKTNNVTGSVALGNNWTWTVHVANAGSVPATFTNASTVLLDSLPTGNISYGAPSLVNIIGISGTLIPSLDGSGNLTVTASGAVTLNVGASFDARLTGTPSAPGTFINPRTGGLCMVDPNNNVLESNKGNNTATDSVTVICPAITLTLGGGGTICPGGSATISVSLSGGTPPYSVTLNNGGGAQSGSSPLLFTVSPGATTTYLVSSGADAEGCPVSPGSSSATVTVSSIPSPTITPSAATVFANSAGNQAVGPGGFSGYAWSITNGIITSAADQPAITYVAGASNTVSLSLTVVNGAGCAGSTLATIPVITGFSVHSNVTFTDGLASTTIGLAFDGTNYWSCSGGSSGGLRLARYSSSGALIATYSPGLDFRSVFTRPDGTLLARAYGTNLIYQQTSPGVFAGSGVSLTGGTLDSQSSVILNPAGTEFAAMAGGVVSRWSATGAYLGSVNLAGFGSVPGENTYPQNRALGELGNLWLTYNGSGILSIWDNSGNRLVQANLPGAGTGFDSGFSFSFCNGKVFIVDLGGGAWRGFDLYSGATAAVLSAEANSAWNTEIMGKIANVGFIPGMDLIPVIGANPVPDLGQLRSYQALMVFSDNFFNDGVALGNVLADYVDQGGGVVVQTFAFETNGFGIQGRLSSGGYLPFTEALAASPGNLTLVKDLPSHPLLDAVSSLNGGTSSYHNSPLSPTPGSVLVAHWSNGQPLVGAKDTTPGRCAGLNFFPASSDSRSDFWLAGTDGARLMADALVWAGRIPPNILEGPVDQVHGLGTTAAFSVVATGTSPLSYQWRLNGTNLPSATDSTLSFTVQPDSSGVYSVVVSNLYGTTTSLGAALNPQLEFLTPSLSAGLLSLFLGDSDGSPVSSNRAPRVRIYGTADLSQPLLNWTLLPNAVVPSNGLLRVDGIIAPQSQNQFFRAVEAP